MLFFLHLLCGVDNVGFAFASAAVALGLAFCVILISDSAFAFRLALLRFLLVVLSHYLLAVLLDFLFDVRFCLARSGNIKSF